MSIELLLKLPVKRNAGQDILIDLSDAFGFRLYQFPEAFGFDNLDHIAMLQDPHLDLREIGHRESQFQGTIPKDFGLLVPMPYLVSDPS